MESIISVIQKQPDLCTLGGASEEEIIQAEAVLGVAFADDYRQYVAAYGAASFGGHELTGVCISHRLSVIEVTIEERRANGTIPPGWYVVEQANIDGIVIWQSADGLIYQTGSGASCSNTHDSLVDYCKSFSI